MFSFTKEFDKKFPVDALLKNLSGSTSSMKLLKDYVLSKLKFYTRRTQTNLYSATQKHIGDCDEPKVIYNFYNTMTKIIATPVANIFIGEVSIT